MTADLPDDLRSLDEKLFGLFADFAPPADLDARIAQGLARRSRLRFAISPAVVKSAAAVVAVGLLGTFGYVADRQMNGGVGETRVVKAEARFDPTMFSGAEYRSSSEVASLIATSRQLTEKGQYEEALKVADQILKIDPRNAYATGVRQILFDRASLSKQRSLSNKFDEKLVESLERLEAKKIPYEDMLKYPADWPDLAARREQTVKEETKTTEKGQDVLSGDGPVDMAYRRPVTSSPQPEATPKLSVSKFEAPGGGGGGGRADVDGDGLASAKEGLKLGEDRTKSLSDHRFAPATLGVEKEKPVGGVVSQSAVVTQSVAAPANQLPENRPADDAEKDGRRKTSGGWVAAVVPGEGQGQPAAPAVVAQQKVIRSGTVEFEVDSFDAALMTITKLVIEDGGFVASTDSSKLPNGKTRGAVTLRIPPERLDTFVLKLRGLGDLKSQKISAQDVSKAYSDIDSGLRAARAMETRLLEMIQKGQGSIKDLLAAEKELGVWRQKIEQLEGEKRYYDNLIGLSTLTVALQERDIRASAASIETESVSAGVETEDVEKSRAELIKAIDEAKGRIITSDLKKLDAGQFAATIVAEVAPEQSGPLVDRLKQLGKVARLDVDRRQTTVDGNGTPLPGAQVEKKPSRLTVSLYNLANVAPRLTTSLTVAADDVQERYREIIAAVEKAGGRVASSNLRRPKQDEVAATLQIEVPAAQAAATQAMLSTAGEVMNLQLNENPDTANVTTAKQGFAVQVISARSVPARESANLQLAAKNVAGAHKALFEIARKAGARVIQSSVIEGDRDRISGVLQIELPRASQEEWDKALADAGEVLTRSAQRSDDTQNTLDGKLRLNVTLFPADRLPPRQTTNSVINVRGTESVQATFIAMSEQLGGRVIDQNVAREPTGRNSARVVFDVPRDKASLVIKELRGTGEIWHMNTQTNADAPDGSLSRSRFDLTFAEAEGLVGRDAGVWANIRDGLSTSLQGLAWSLRLIVIGVCLVAPWGLVLWVAWKLLRRRKNKPVAIA